LGAGKKWISPGQGGAALKRSPDTKQNLEIFQGRIIRTARESITESLFVPIIKYEGKTFENQVFLLEECWFVNCVLRRCTIFYSGGSYELVNTTFENCDWKFQGPANLTCQILTMIGLLKSGQAPAQQIQAKGSA
jgi:hypothetical protein